MATWGDKDLRFFSDEERAEVKEHADKRMGMFMSMSKKELLKKHKEDGKRMQAWSEANPDVSGYAGRKSRFAQNKAREKAQRKAAMKKIKAASKGKKGKGKRPDPSHWYKWSEDGNTMEQHWGTREEYEQTASYEKYKKKRDFKLGDPEAWKSTQATWMANRKPKADAQYRVTKMMQKYSPGNKNYDPETDREKYLYYKDVSAKIRSTGTTSREDIYNNMTKGEASSMANAYEPSLFTSQNSFNTQSTRDVASGKKGTVGNVKAGDSVYNPKSSTRKRVSKSIRSRGQKLTASRKATTLDRATERMF